MCKKRVLLNDPFQRTLQVADDITPYLEERQMRIWFKLLVDVMSTTVTVLYEELVTEPTAPDLDDVDDLDAGDRRIQAPMPTKRLCKKTVAAVVVPEVTFNDHEATSLVIIDFPRVTCAPCANGIISVHNKVTWNLLEFTCRAMVEKGNHRAFAHLVNEETEAFVPCSVLKVNAGESTYTIYEPPTSNSDLIQMAYSIVKANLMNLQGAHRQRPHENFEVMEFRPCFVSAFGFPIIGAKSSSEAIFSLEAGGTALWDQYFGTRWDVVADETYVVTRITFRREKFKAPFALLCKLRCKLDLVNFSAKDDYRQYMLVRLQDKFRHHNDTSSASGSQLGSQLFDGN